MTPERLREIIAEELAYRFAIDEGLWDDANVTEPRDVESNKNIETAKQAK